MRLNELSPYAGSTTKKKRLGRGIGSGKGKTSGRGHKGQRSRAGASRSGEFEGGQMPLHMRVPKRGFKPPYPTRLSIVNIDDLQRALDKGRLQKNSPIDTKALVEAGLITHPRDGIKILGRGTLKDSLDIHVVGISKSARKSVEDAGGKVSLIKTLPKAPSKEEKPSPKESKTAKTTLKEGKPKGDKPQKSVSGTSSKKTPTQSNKDTKE